MTPKFKKKAELAKFTASLLKERLTSCDICPRNCRVNRRTGERGYCGANKDLVVYSSFLHCGEEPGISGWKGSGTVFFSGCNLKCLYCQNYKFSHSLAGKKITETDLAKIMLNLQREGAHNINLVTPTHFLPQILDALVIALDNGLNIPIVYNTSGYEKKEIIRGLAGIVDIYLTDFKYIDSSLAKRYSNAPEYREFASGSLLEMARQAQPLISQKLLKKGVVIRHLILPNHIQESKALLSWIKENTPKALVSVMFQYQPYFKAHLYPQINRPINRSEYQEIKKFVEEINLKGWVQDHSPQEDMAGPYFEPNI